MHANHRDTPSRPKRQPSRTHAGPELASRRPPRPRRRPPHRTIPRPGMPERGSKRQPSGPARSLNSRLSRKPTRDPEEATHRRLQRARSTVLDSGEWGSRGYRGRARSAEDSPTASQLATQTAISVIRQQGRFLDHPTIDAQRRQQKRRRHQMVANAWLEAARLSARQRRVRGGELDCRASSARTPRRRAVLLGILKPG